MKTVEELLIQRYKVIAPYPGMKDHDWKVEDILDRNWCTYENDDEDAGVIEWQVSDYPHLFQPLPWWSDREVEDMPEYVRSIKQEYEYGVVVGKVIKVKEWVLLSETMYVFQSKTREYHPSCFVPATREEYELFKQQKINKQ